MEKTKAKKEKMKDSIKKHLPYFQFGAGVITIVLGLNSGIEQLFLNNQPPTSIYDESSFIVSQTELPKGNGTQYRVSYMPTVEGRECTKVSADLKVVDADGFVYEIIPSTIMKLDEDIHYFYFRLVKNGESKKVVADETNTIEGSMTFNCKGALITVELPTTLRFTPK